MFKFTLDPNNAKAFKKEKAWANWGRSVSTRYQGVGQTFSDLPVSVTDGVDVRGRRSVVIQIHPQDPAELYDVKVYAGMKSQNFEGWYAMDGGDYVELKGKQLIGANVHLADYVYVLVTKSTSNNPITVNVAPLIYEDELDIFREMVTAAITSGATLNDFNVTRIPGLVNLAASAGIDMNLIKKLAAMSFGGTSTLNNPNVTRKPGSMSLAGAGTVSVSETFTSGAAAFVSWAKTNLSPTILLHGHETGDTVAVDESGNGNDGAYDGANYTLGQPAFFAEDGLSVALTATDTITWATMPTVGSQWSAFYVGEMPDRSGNSTIFDQNSDRIVWYEPASSNGLTVYTVATSNVASSYPVGRNFRTVLGLSCDSTNAKFYQYMHGLPFHEGALGAGGVAIGGSRLRFSAYNDGTNNAAADVSTVMFENSAMTHAQQYDAAAQIGPGAVPSEGHYYKTSIVDAGLATLGVSGDVWFHYPLWEEAGTKAIDVSMRRAHGTFIGGPTLGQAPSSLGGALHSVAFTSTQNIELPAAVTDISGNRTISLRFKTTATEAELACWKTSTGGLYVLLWINAGKLRLQIYDGTNLVVYETTTNYNDGAWHRVTIRLDWTADTVATWANGTKLDERSISAVVPNVTDQGFLGGGAALATSLAGSLELPIGFSKALTDAQCAAL